MGKNKPIYNQDKEIFSLSMRDFLHLENDKYIEHDNSQYVLKQPVQKKEETVRPAVVFSKSEVAQYFSTGRGNETDAKLARKAHEAIEVLKAHVKQGEANKTSAAEKGNTEAPKKQIEEVLNFDFEDLILDSMLKD
jgi:hypothetical protein